MAIALSGALGRLITGAELDGNFTDLDGRLDAIETAGGVAESVASASLLPNGNVQFVGSRGNVLGEIPAASRPVNWRGNWAAGAAYQRNDLVRISGGDVMIVEVTHVATTVTADRAAGRISTFAPAGMSFLDFAAPYDPARTYTRGSMVSTTLGTPPFGFPPISLALWICIEPPGLNDGGPGVSPAWLRLSFSAAVTTQELQHDKGPAFGANRIVTLASYIADLESRASALLTRIQTLEAKALSFEGPGGPDD